MQEVFQRGNVRVQCMATIGGHKETSVISSQGRWPEEWHQGREVYRDHDLDGKRTCAWGEGWEWGLGGSLGLSTFSFSVYTSLPSFSST